MAKDLASRRNCWQFTECGFEPGGRNAHLGICPAATDTRFDGINGGRNGGRACWAVSWTLRGRGRISGNCHEKFLDCLECPFLRTVCQEEGADFVTLTEILRLVGAESPPAR